MTSPSPHPRVLTFSEVASVFIPELFILFGGLLGGFFWAMASSQPDWSETWDIIIGLGIIILCTLRLTLSLKMHFPRRNVGELTQNFLKEVGLLIGGLLIGAFWFSIYREEHEFSMHIVVMLMMVLIVMIRYLSLIFPKSGPDAE